MKSSRLGSASQLSEVVDELLFVQVARVCRVGAAELLQSKGRVLFVKGVLLHCVWCAEWRLLA